MAPYNVMIMEANSAIGFRFLRQLLSMPFPPEYIFAVCSNEDNFEDLTDIQESSKNSKVIICEMDLKQPAENSLNEIKTAIEKTVENIGLDLLINITCLKNEESDSISTVTLENQFETSTVTSLMLFQIMRPLLEAAVVRSTKCNLKSKSVFFNITEDNSNDLNPFSEINKVALNLAMDVMADTVRESNVLVLSTCLKLEKNDGLYKTELENSVASNLLYALCSSQSQKPVIDLNDCTVYEW